jgi:DNA-binding NtrC family response regulator
MRSVIERSTRNLVPPRSVRFRRLRVQVVGGPDRGLVCVSREDSPEISVGTVKGNDLVLADPTVSRHHLVIRAEDGGFHLRDLGSTNGTVVAGCRVETAWIAPGTTLRLGETTVQFAPLEEEVEVRLSDAERFGRVLGRSPAMRRLFEMLSRIAPTDTTILIEGETGTGKELVAEAIHAASTRAGGPFQVVDCGAIPRTLIESELFGHERGAFTGASDARVGAFEATAGGTLFLDEIGELPLDMQPKLLRALEQRTIRRIGAETSVRLDVRVVAATHRDLRREVNRGAFRSDLFYRLNVVRVCVPPLRDRREDIPLLASAFWDDLASDGEMPPELLEALCTQDWPGNVRELKNALERSILVGDPAMMRAFVEEVSAPPAGPTLAPEIYDSSLAFRAAKERGVARWEREYVLELIRRHEGNVSAAARAARMDRNHLSDLLTRHGVEAKPAG